MTGTASPDGSAGVDPGAVQTEAQRIQTMMEDAELNFQSFQQRLAITYTLEGMQQVAQALAGFPGRKSLIWAGGGFPFNVSDNTMQLAPAGRDTLTDVLPMYEHTWQLLNNAQIALYPLDVKGLQYRCAKRLRAQPGKELCAQYELAANGYPGDLADLCVHDRRPRLLQLQRSGKGFSRRGERFRRSTTCWATILIGRIPRPGWRKLAVKVKREHTEVRARTGFFVTNATVDPENSRNSDIASALQSPLDYTSLPLVVHWDKVEPSKEPGKKRVNYAMHLAPDAALIDVRRQ